MNPNVALAGDLKFLNLGDLLQLLGSNGVTGILRIKSQYTSGMGVIYIVKGNPINAVSDSQSGLDALFELFGWVDGEFEFSSESVAKEDTIKKSRMEIILDGLRKLDDGQIKKLGPDAQAKKTDDVSAKDAGPVIKGPLVDYMYIIDEETFSEGQKIVLEKKHGNWIWVIMEGRVSIVKETPAGPLKMLTISDGSFIGSVASFYIEGNIRGATTIAESKVHLGVLDTQRLATEFSSISHEFRGFLMSLDHRLRQVSNRAVDIYSKQIKLEEYLKGRSSVIKQGESNDKIFTIKSGEASVVRRLGKAYVPLAHLSVGDVFGHIPFIDMGQEPKSASVFAEKDNIEVTELDPNQLYKEYENVSQTFKNIIENLATCISATSNLACEYYKKLKKKP